MFYPSPGNDKPTIQELSRFVIHQYATQWKDVGALLGLQDYKIANIASDYRNQCVDACREMLSLWLRSNASPTWGKLDDTIKSLMAISSSKPKGSYVYMIYIAIFIVIVVLWYYLFYEVYKWLLYSK